MPCSSAIFASRECSSSALPWRRRARHTRRSREAGTAAALQLPRRTRRPHRARPLPCMLRPLHISPRRAPRLRHTLPRRVMRRRKPPHRDTRRRALPRRTPHPRHASPHRAMRLRKRPPRATRRKLPYRARRKRLALRRSGLRVPPAGREPRPWRGTRRRRSSRKSAAGVPAHKLDRTLPNPASAGIWRAKPRPQQRALGQQQRALRQQRRPLASDAMGLRNKV